MTHLRLQQVATKGGMVALLSLLLLLAGCWPFPGSSSRQSAQTPTPVVNQTGGTLPSNPSAKITPITQQVIENVRQHGWNPQTGGLYTNWQMNNPSNTNNLKLQRAKQVVTPANTIRRLIFSTLWLWQTIMPCIHKTINLTVKFSVRSK